MRWAWLALALGGCALYDGGPAPDPGCAVPEGCGCGDCDAAPLIDVEGDLTLHQSASSVACTAPSARDPLILSVVTGPEKSLTAAAPTIVSASSIFESYDYATVNADLTDTWGDVPVTLSYALTLGRDGSIGGQATGSFADGACDLTVAIEGTYTAP